MTTAIYGIPWPVGIKRLRRAARKGYTLTLISDGYSLDPPDDVDGCLIVVGVDVQIREDFDRDPTRGEWLAALDAELRDAPDLGFESEVSR